MSSQKRYTSAVFYPGWVGPIKIDAFRGALVKYFFGLNEWRKGAYSLAIQATKDPENTHHEAMPSPFEAEKLSVFVIDIHWREECERAIKPSTEENEPDIAPVKFNEEMAKDVAEGVRCWNCYSPISVGQSPCPNCDTPLAI